MDNDKARAGWRTSTYSNGQGNCVEADSDAETVYVRDTKDRAGAVLAFGADAWAAFADGIKGH
jgi:hypothetical protein